MSKAGAAHRTDFMILRREGRPAVRIYLPHAHVFKALWQCWLEKRAASQPAEVTIAELMERLEANRNPHAESSIRSAMRSLMRGRAATSRREFHGMASVRVFYTPTEEGVHLFAIAEMLGDGSSVQVGRSRSAWENRAQSVPGDLFAHANLRSPLDSQ